MRRRLLWFALFAAIFAWFGKDGQAQNPVQFQPTSTDPTGRVCGNNQGNLKTPDGKLYTCQNGHMAQISASGGSVTLGGDTTGPSGANTTSKVNNEAIPVSAGALGTDANGGLIAVTPGGGTTPGYPANQPVSGCGVEYVSGLTFNVGACVYTIGGVQYTSPQTSITLTTADPSHPRLDVIHVNNASVVADLVGTPAATPVQPTVDYSTELPLNIVLVPAGSSTPGGITITTIYDENTEWTSTCSAHLNCASTSNPFRGTVDIEATAAVLGNNFTLVKPTAGTTDLSTQNTLIFYIRSKAAWPSANNTGANGLRTLSLFWLNGSTQVGVQVVLKDGAFGFSSSNTTGYQQIAIPISNFGTGSSLVTTLKAQVTGNGGTSSFGWYIDAVSLQAGQGPLSLPATLMNFKGTWSSTANYNANDTVVSGGCGYAALVPNTNVAVTTTATWASLCGARVIATGTLALNTTAVSANTCGSAQTSSATGVLTTDAISWAPNADITAVTGYNVAGTFGLEIFIYPTADTINAKVCNTTSSSITPGATVTLNYRVTR